MGSYIEEKIREMGYEGNCAGLYNRLEEAEKKYYDKSRKDGTKTETIKRENILPTNRKSKNN